MTLRRWDMYIFSDPTMVSGMPPRVVRVIRVTRVIRFTDRVDKTTLGTAMASP